MTEHTPGPLAALLGAVRTAELPAVVLTLGGVTDKAAFMERCARDLDLPHWFGRNWDALADSLTELPRGTLLVVRGWQEYAATRPEEWAVAQDVLAESSGERLSVLLALDPAVN
ncbi:barstar family protein [Streptomyces luteolus]|uniref:Barstar family protein n=1 Tax=Streptomyces luteolus TaxID=3043615 RepID=A0ABT6SYI1_9ACTN|nr:barstar family protein [Streptomyces sp. B-S-A12]MDI3420173.1 barstar family protein [Streptomyces sp. B-S-A12]